MIDSTPRFLYRFAHPAQDVEHEREVLFDVDGSPRSATAYVPDRGGGHRPTPAWILLQGITVPGRHHTGVRRMARALATAGHLALVPEVPSWTALRVDPREAEPTVRSALAFLGTWPGVDPRRVGLMGFSVAATWALAVAAGLGAAPTDGSGQGLRAVVGVGGYADFRRMLAAMVVGEHEWDGEQHRYTPDPYGRWILGANLLPLVEGGTYGTREERETAGRALHRLAETAGRNGALARTPVYDDLIGQLRGTVLPGALPAWDLLAPPSRRLVPDREAGRALAGVLADAGLRTNPEFDLAGRLGSLRLPTILLHGRMDTLVPFTETLRLAERLPPPVRRGVTVTRLLGHTKLREAGTPWRNPLALADEARRFVRTVRHMLEALEQ